jgi:tyrosine-protein kinase Etk/Wzc
MSVHTTYPPIEPPSRDGDSTPIARNVAIVLQNWKLVVLVAGLVVLAGLSYLLLAPPVFRADVLIQVEDPNGGARNDTRWPDRSVPHPTFEPSAAAATETELVRSRLVLERTVNDLHLDIEATPVFFPLFGKSVALHAKQDRLSTPLMGMTGFAWGGERIDVSVFNAPYDSQYTLVAGQHGRYTLTNKDGDIVASGVVGQPTTGFDGGERLSIRVDELVANSGMRFVIKRLPKLDAIAKLQHQLVVEQLGKDAGILSVSLEGERSASITEIVNEVARVYVTQNAEHKKEEMRTTLAFLDTQLPETKARLEEAEHAYNAFRNAHGTVNLDRESELLLEQIVDAKTKQIQLEQKRNELAQRFFDQYPDIVALTGDIEALKAYQRSLADKVLSMPNTEQEALRLQRDVRVNTELYMTMLKTAQQLSIAAAGEVGNVRVVDWAMKPTRPAKPKKLIVAGISVILALTLGVLAPFVRRGIKPAIENSWEIEHMLGAPVYSVVPHSARQAKLGRSLRRGGEGQHLLAFQAPDDAAIEAIRTVQTSPLFCKPPLANNMILVTGACQDVGKSFIAANLAAVLAAGGQRVLLIDADFRDGDVNRYFGLRSEPGFSDAIAGEQADAVIHRRAAPGLDLLPRGKKPLHPTQWLMSERCKDLLDALATCYDVIVIDAPPILPVADATILAKYAGMTLFAMRHGRHTAADIVEAERRLRIAGLNVSGVLLTDVPQSKMGYGTYYGSR